MSFPRVHPWAASIAQVLLLALPSTAFAFTKAGTTYTTDGSQADVSAAIGDSTPGDTVSIPAGSFTWGAGKTSVYLDKAITLAGAGPALTTINIAADAPTYGSGVIGISGAATVRDFTTTQSGLANTTAFVTSTTNGWRITNIVHNSGAQSGYFVYAGAYGLIDSCTINAGGGSDELIFSRGPTDSWQTPSSMGTADAVYVEDCTFNNPGYVCDFNSNARGVVRFSTITNSMKIDGHGVASNTPPRSVRHMEVYGNHWTLAGTSYFAAIELRGGTGVVFDNIGDNEASDWFFLTEYGYLGKWPNFNSVYQTPADYPVADQIGVGMDPKVGGSEPYYVWNNLRNGAAWERSVKQVNPEAIMQYGQPFAETDVVQADRDFFWEGAAFDGSSGIGRGKKAQMMGIKPTKAGVGFWVTDEGSWNTKIDGPSGQLYAWNGSAWVLKYTPYTYPHPLRGGPQPMTPDGGLSGGAGGGAATGTGGAGATGTGGANGSGGSAKSAPASTGCGCVVAGEEVPEWWRWMVVVPLAAGLRRRHVRARRRGAQ